MTNSSFSDALRVALRLVHAGFEQRSYESGRMLVPSSKLDSPSLFFSRSTLQSRGAFDLYAIEVSDAAWFVYHNGKLIASSTDLLALLYFIDTL